MHNLPPEACGALATSCPKCNHGFELPALHLRICMLSDQAKKLTADVTALRTLLQPIADRYVKELRNQPATKALAFRLRKEQFERIVATLDAWS